MINQIQTELITQIYSYSATFTFLSQSIVHIKHMCFSFKISSAPKGFFCGVGQSSSEICSLPYSLLLDYSTLRSLPYPTLLEVEKLLLVGACVLGINWGMSGSSSGHVWDIIWCMPGASSGACLGHHLGHVWGIIWGMSGACLRHVWGIIWGMSGHHLGHVWAYLGHHMKASLGHIWGII